MLAYLNLFLTIAVAAVTTYVNTWKRFERDWVFDPRLLLPICIEVGFQSVLTICAYFEIVHFSRAVPFLAQNELIVTCVAAMFAHILSHHLMGAHLYSSIQAKLAGKKDEIAIEIGRHPQGLEILTTALETVDIRVATKRKVATDLVGRSVHDQAITVIRTIGLACPHEILRTRIRSAHHA